MFWRLCILLAQYQLTICVLCQAMRSMSNNIHADGVYRSLSFLYFKECRNLFPFWIIPQHWAGTGCWNPSFRVAKICSTWMFSIFADDPTFGLAILEYLGHSHERVNMCQIALSLTMHNPDIRSIMYISWFNHILTRVYQLGGIIDIN